MIGSRRRARSAINVWPGYVDALSALLMLVIFMLLVYVVSQLYLSQTLSDRDAQLASLNDQLAEISTLLGLEQQETAELRQAMASLQATHNEILAENDALKSELDAKQDIILAQRYDIEAQAIRLADMQESVTSVRDQLTEKEALTATQEAFIRRLADRIEALQEQLSQISAALKLQTDLTAEKEAEIAELGQRLNTLLAERVSKLEKYQSEFFGRLREILADKDNIRVVGDRFLLPTELLFASGSARLEEEGIVELNKLAGLLLEVAEAIPDDIDWILRIDGHTDQIPIRTAAFPSNWELSTARAVAVVRYLAQQGVPEEHMAAAGFGEFYPVAEGTTEEALRRNRRIELKLTDR